MRMNDDRICLIELFFHLFFSLAIFAWTIVNIRTYDDFLAIFLFAVTSLYSFFHIINVTISIVRIIS